MEISPKHSELPKKGTVTLIPKTKLSANLLAALLLVARPHLRELELARVTAKAVLEATGAKKSRAYELADALGDQLDGLVATVGRPSTDDAEPSEGHHAALLEVARACLEYLLAHPGAAQQTGGQARYSDGFRDFVVSQCVAHPELDTAALAEALALPVSTVRGWLRGARAGVEHAMASDADVDAPAPRERAPGSSASQQLIELVLTEWKTWCGPSFTSFCAHLRDHCAVPFERMTIASILELTGERLPTRRPGRSPDEEALRGTFESFFPGAVWVGDGCEVLVELGDQRFSFNLELLVDAHSSAFVGLDVRDHEDSDAVLSAFEEGLVTTLPCPPPLSVLLDNKPCNHAPAVHEATDAALVIPATLGRPQNKGHVEGAFGLFSQLAPPLRLDGSNPKERARQLVELGARIFFGALNMRPQAKREGRSRIDHYRETAVTLEQIEQAKKDLQARLDKQLAAQRTRLARLEPAKRAYLERELAVLKLDDPTARFFAALARYDLDDIVDGVAIWKGKTDAGTLPAGVDIRYLLGIVRNVANKREGMAIAKALWDERLAARSFVFDALTRERDAISNSQDDGGLVCFVDKALETERLLERHFWLDAAAEVVLALPPADRRNTFERAAHRIHTSFRVPHRRRLSATRALAGMVLPLA